MAERFNTGALRPTPLPRRVKKFGAETFNFSIPPAARSDIRSPYAPRDQGDVPCCVSHAITFAVEALIARHGGESGRLSVLYQYFHARAGGSIGPIDPTSAMATAASDGICLDEYHPVVTASRPERFTIPMAQESPDNSADMDAGRRRFLTRQPSGRSLLIDLQGSPAADWKSALTAGFPIVCTLKFCDGYDRMRLDGTVTLENIGLIHPAAFHTVVICGHDDAARHFIIADSYLSGSAPKFWNLPYTNTDTLTEQAMCLEAFQRLPNT